MRYSSFKGIWIGFPWSLVFKHALFLVVFFVACPKAYSQSKALDSLTKELEQHTKKDKTKVELLNNIAYEHHGKNQEELLKFANQALKLAKKIKDKKGEARSWYLKSLYHLTKRELKSAKINIDKAHELNQKIGNNSGISDCYYVMAIVYNYNESYDTSLMFFNKALQIEKEEGDKNRMADFLNAIGHTHSLKGEFRDAEITLKKSIHLYDSLNQNKKILGAYNNLALLYSQQDRNIEALRYFQNCLTGYREQENKVFGAAVLLNIALIHSNMNENDKALPYLREGLEIAKELKNKLQISKYLIGLGYTHRYKKEYDKALGYYNEGLKICKQIDSKEGLYNCYMNIGGMQIERKEFEAALNSFTKGLQINKDLGNKRGIAESLVQLGLIHFNLGNHTKALKNTLEGKKIADELFVIRTQNEASLLLSKLYAKEKNYKKALEYFKEHKMYSDSLYNKENIEKIAQLEAEYKYKKAMDSANRRELKLTKIVKTTSANLEKTKRNYLWVIIGVLFLAMVLGSIIFYQKLKHEKSKTQKAIIEQKLLRSQMTPHFIFNSLAVLQGMILNQDENANVYLSKFSSLIRITLENSRHTKVSLAKELKAIENYIDLQNMHTEPKFMFNLVLDERINVDETKVPPMLIQPFVENAIEHAFSSRAEDKRIDVHLTLQNRELKCTIEDNGIGIKQGLEKKSSHKQPLATTITEERLAMLSKEFKTKGSLSTTDKKQNDEQGTLVTLIIPYKIEKNP